MAVGSRPPPNQNHAATRPRLGEETTGQKALSETLMAIAAARTARARRQPALPRGAGRYAHDRPPRLNRGRSKRRPRSRAQAASPLKTGFSHPKKKGTGHRSGAGAPVTACVHRGVQSGRCRPSPAVPSATLRHFPLPAKCRSWSESASSAAEKRLRHLPEPGLRLAPAPCDPTAKKQGFLGRSVTVPPGIGRHSRGQALGRNRGRQ